MSFEKFWFKPAHQPDEEKPVEFELKPLDNPMLFRLLKGYASDDGLQWEDLSAVLTYHVTGWRGLPEEYAPHVKRTMLAGEANIDLQWWLGEIAKELYRAAVLKDSERKNS